MKGLALRPVIVQASSKSQVLHEVRDVKMATSSSQNPEEWEEEVSSSDEDDDDDDEESLAERNEICRTFHSSQ